jgi:uncharacterized coiled-coil DUF342 family protein
MKVAFVVLVGALAAQTNPLSKTIELLESLQAKVVKDGENAQKVYEEFKEYCDDQSKELQFGIKTASSDVERAQATIAKESANADAAAAKIEDLSAAIATDEADLKAAGEIRAKEAGDFQAADADLAETISMLRRAAAIIEREMKGGSFLQSDSMSKITDALQTLVSAQSVTSLDKSKVQALLQSADKDEDWLGQPAGAPAAAAYESQSGGILDVLEDMLEKAEAQQADGQKAEMVAKHNFEMLAQKLKDSIKHQNDEMDRAKKAKAEADQARSTAEGELATATKMLNEGEKMLSDLQNDCMTKATEFDTEQKERGEELEALATAKSILEEKTGGAADRTYSFLQVQASSRSKAKAAETSENVIALVQSLAAKDGSTELAQLASRLRNTVSQAAMDGADPFAKVKGLISEMIEKLVADAQKEADHKAFCDKEMSETKAKREDKQDEVDDLSNKIDTATAKIAKLKEEVATLQGELAEIARVQKEADETRAAEKKAFQEAKADYESGLEGVGIALQVLRDYYAEKPAGDESVESLLQSRKHTKATGAATGIIGMLEVIESDFSKMLAQATAGEDQAQREYDQLTQENKVATATKTTAAEYKEKDGKETAALLAGYESDRGVAQEELDAILEYWEKLQPMCVAKAEPYAERKKRRDAEIAGLKQALEILENESATSFLQMRK